MRRLESLFAQAMRLFAGLCFVAIVVLVVANIVSRGAANLPDTVFVGPDWLAQALRTGADFAKSLSAPWFDEITQLLTAWMVFIGAAALWRDRQHFRAEFVDAVLGERAFNLIEIGVTLFSLIFLLVMTYYGWVLVERTSTESSILQWPRAWWLASVPTGAAIMAAYSLWDLDAAITGLITGRDFKRRHRGAGGSA